MIAVAFGFRQDGDARAAGFAVQEVRRGVVAVDAQEIAPRRQQDLVTTRICILEELPGSAPARFDGLAAVVSQRQRDRDPCCEEDGVEALLLLLPELQLLSAA